jgi:peptide/nickel transport system substrate-binding protein
MTDHPYDDRVDPGGGIQRSEFLRRALLSGVALSGVGGLLSETTVAEARGSALARSAASTRTLTYRTRADIEFVDPAFSSSVADNIVEHQIFEGLLGYEPTPKPSIVNQLVDEWEPNANGTQYRFKLKQGVMFHKGFGELKASDVQYTIYRVAGFTKPNINSAYSGDWVALDQVKVTGPYEGVIMLKYPYVPLLTQSIPYVSGLIVCSTRIRSAPALMCSPAGRRARR